MDSLFLTSNRLIRSTDNHFQRGLMGHIDWTQRLIEIRGSRGVGKTTLMLQKAKELQQKGGKVLYTSLDTPYFFTHSILELVEDLSNYGISTLFLDEVHRYPAKYKESDWSLELKNVYDAYPDINIVYSGSSILHLHKGKGDLSRRKAGYLMPGLSMREFAALKGVATIEPVDFTTLLEHHESLAGTISEQFKPLPLFKKYLSHGYYPFYSHNETVYQTRLREIVNLIIDADLPYVASISPQAKEQLKRLLGALATTVPYVPNMGKLADKMQITDQRTLLKYLNLLEEAQLITLLRSDSKGNKILQKPDKIYLNNTNLSRALGLQASDIGTERETFFLNQVSAKHQVNYAKKGDFVVNHQTYIEVGGRQKTRHQFGQHERSQAYIAADDIEIGYDRKIPLWLFGFLY